jgi:LysM repeat protein
MGFWNRVKDVLVSGPTTAVKNERAEDAVERESDAAEKAREKVEVPPQSAPQPPVSTPEPEATTEPAAAEPEYRTYTVKSGDTLSEIAASFGVDWHEMARLNNLENPDLIFPGQVFKVPN